MPTDLVGRQTVVSSLTFGSLFSGIGGFDLGLERAGMTAAWQCEIDRDARKVLAARWPGVACYEDVKELSGGDVPTVDVLCGGFPCQDLSVAGRRAGLAGERSGLFHEFMRLASEITPRWVVIENVPGLLSSNEGRDMGVVLGVLADLGYGWAYRVLDAQYFGVAQRRRRVFIVGCLGDPAGAAAVLLEPESCDGDSPPRREAGERPAASLTAGTASGSGVNAPGRRGEDDINLVASTLQGGGRRGARIDAEGAAGGHLVSAITARYYKGTDSDATDGLVPEPYTFDWQAGGHGDESFRGKSRQWIEDPPGRTRSLVANKTLAVAFHQTQEPITEEEMSPAIGATSIGMGVAYSTKLHNTHSNQAGKLYEEYTPSLQADSPAPAVAYSVAVRGREDGQEWELGEPDIGNALRAGDGGSSRGNWALTPHLAVRRLTPTECERLQGFPDGWTEGLTDSARYRVLGNAVCVPVAEWIAHRIVEVSS